MSTIGFVVLGIVIVVVAAVAAWLGAWLAASRPRFVAEFGKRVEEELAGTEKRVGDDLERVRGSFQESVGRLQEAQVQAFTGLQERVERRLDAVREDNERKLEAIRATVEEKLQTTLETRLGESFRTVSDRLEQVHKGLGEMRELAAGVGDLKKVLTNVKSRGTWGEVQLGTLLEQVLVPEQYATGVETVPGSGERVEFAIRLPGRDEGAPVWLPIDAKFPLEDYVRLQDAQERGDPSAVEVSSRALRQRVLGEARKIREKYVSPPGTTDFGLLYLPTEGLYAEVLRIPGLPEELQVREHVVPVGPTTLFAILSSLQMGFRTLAIEKRSSEVWRLLAAVKTEFGAFGQSLDAVREKIEQAQKKMEAVAVRSRAVEKKLKDVEALPEGEAAALLPEDEA